MPRSVFAIGAALLLLSLTSCGRGHSPTTASTDLDPAVARTPGQASAYEYIPARFHVQVDPGLGSATVTPVRDASASPQAKSFDLDIANFTNADSFNVTGVQVLNADELQITFTHAHPFPAPDFTKPVTSLNRADLGYTGRLVILADGTSQSFFSNEVTLDPSLVIRPDGYVNTGDLLADTSLTNDTFPYVLLADDFNDNRVGISNEDPSSPDPYGFPRGNYAVFATNGGWNALNIIGPSTANNGWTGFDYVHGGQTIENSFVLSLDALSATAFDFDVAMLIKYTDPRGAPGKTYRLPLATVDNTKFCYRLPFAALDCSQVAYSRDCLQVDPKLNDILSFQVYVRDYDSNAVEAADADLSDELGNQTVPPGTSGRPLVEIEAPALQTGSMAYETSPHEEGFVRATVALANVAMPTPGDYFGALRVTDPEEGSVDRPAYHFGVDPVTLAGSPTRALRAVTYQVFEYTVLPAARTNGWLRPLAQPTEAAASAGTAGDLGINAIAVDATNNRVYVGGRMSGGAFNFMPGGAGVVHTASSGSTDAMLVRMENNNDVSWVRSWGGPGTDPLANVTRPFQQWPQEPIFDEIEQIMDLACDASGNVFALSILLGSGDMDPGAGITNLASAGSMDVLISKFDGSGTLLWVRRIGGSGADKPMGLAALPSGGVVAVGWTLTSTIDLDPGAGTSNFTGGTTLPAAFIVALDSSGNFAWGKTVAAPMSQAWDVAVGATTVDVVGRFRGSGINFAPPSPGTDSLTSTGFDAFLLRTDLAGTHIKAFQWGTPDPYPLGSSVTDLASHVTIGGTNTYILSMLGLFNTSTTADLDPSTGVLNVPVSDTGGNLAAALVAFSAAGTYQWGGVTQSYMYFNKLAIDGSGQVTLGWTPIDGADIDFGPGTQTVPNGTGAVLGRYNPATGTLQAAHYSAVLPDQYTSGGDFIGMATAPDGSIYFTESGTATEDYAGFAVKRGAPTQSILWGDLDPDPSSCRCGFITPWVSKVDGAGNW